MYLLNLSYIKSPAQVEPEMKAHGEWVRKYLADGTFLFAGAKKSGLGGIIAAKGIDKKALMAILAEDSYVSADVGEYQIAEVDIKLAQAEYESLKSV
jgi:uncharacterized protein YciI